MKIVPGDLGTKGGLVTDERARVLRPDGTVIEGLYAAGNVSAAVMGRTYAGPGATIGPALTFGYLAAEDIAARGEEQGRQTASQRRLLMPIDPPSPSAPRCRTAPSRGTSSDVLLYHLAIGAGSRPGDHLSPAALRYTVDDAGLQVLPSFGIVAPTFHETDPPPLDLPGCDIDLAQVVHGSQSIAVSGPLPTAGTATLRTRISDVWDKGRAAVIWQEGEADLRHRRGRCGRSAPRSSSAARAAGAVTAARRSPSRSPTARPTPTRRTT